MDIAIRKVIAYIATSRTEVVGGLRPGHPNRCSWRVMMSHERKTMRKPAMKFPQLRKKLGQAKPRAGPLKKK